MLGILGVFVEHLKNFKDQLLLLHCCTFINDFVMLNFEIFQVLNLVKNFLFRGLLSSFKRKFMLIDWVNAWLSQEWFKRLLINFYRRKILLIFLFSIRSLIWSLVFLWRCKDWFWTCISVTTILFVGFFSRLSLHKFRSLFFIFFFDILSIDILSIDTLSIDILSIDILSIDILSIDILSIDILSIDTLSIDILSIDSFLPLSWTLLLESITSAHLVKWSNQSSGWWFLRLECLVPLLGKEFYILPNVDSNRG